MTEEHVKKFSELFNFIYKSNSEAIKVSFALLNVAHLWDDLIDKDKEVDAGRINSAFLDALSVIAGSPLWDSSMQAHIINVFYRWSDANYIEKHHKNEDNELSKAWMLRASCYDLFVIIAGKLYGHNWALNIGPTVRRTYGEQLKDYLVEMKNA